MAFDAVYASGEDPNLALWPVLNDARAFTRDGIVQSALRGDDFGNLFQAHYFGRAEFMDPYRFHLSAGVEIGGIPGLIAMAAGGIVLGLIVVLLLIFMLTAPILQSSIDVNVPKTKTVKEIAEERLIVSIDRKQRVFLGNDAVSPFREGR